MNFSAPSSQTGHDRLYFIKYLFILERERKRERTIKGGTERRRHRIRSRFQALSSLPWTYHGARTHQLWDRDLGQRQTLTWPSHPGNLRVNALLTPNCVQIPVLPPTNSHLIYSSLHLIVYAIQNSGDIGGPGIGFKGLIKSAKDGVCNEVSVTFHSLKRFSARVKFPICNFRICVSL